MSMKTRELGLIVGAESHVFAYYVTRVALFVQESASTTWKTISAYTRKMISAYCASTMNRKSVLSASESDGMVCPRQLVVPFDGCAAALDNSFSYSAADPSLLPRRPLLLLSLYCV